MCLVRQGGQLVTKGLGQEEPNMVLEPGSWQLEQCVELYTCEAPPYHQHHYSNTHEV